MSFIHCIKNSGIFVKRLFRLLCLLGRSAFMPELCFLLFYFVIAFSTLFQTVVLFAVIFYELDYCA